MKPYKLIGTFLIIIISYVAFFKKNKAEDNSEEFIVGTVSCYAPWVSTNQKGEYEGFDVDVMNVLAKKLNKKLVIKDLGSMTSLFMALEQNKIDAIIWGMSITQDRLQKVAMVHYQGDTTKSYPLIFWNKIPQKIKNINDMSGKNVCVEPASAQDTVLSRYSFINKIPTEKVDDALLNIQYGKADAALVEPAIANKFKNKYPEIQILDVPLNQQDQVQGVGICLKKNNTNLFRQITNAINELKEEGLIKKLEQKWGIE